METIKKIISSVSPVSILMCTVLWALEVPALSEFEIPVFNTSKAVVCGEHLPLLG